MWRTLRQVFCKRSGNPSNLRLGQVQVGEKNDELHALPNGETNAHQRGGYKVRLRQDDVLLHDSYVNLVRAIYNNATTKQQKNVEKLRSLNSGEKDKENCNYGSILDEFKLWFSGVFALSSVISCKNLIYDQDHNIDLKKLPQALYFITTHNPRTALSVLPVVPQDPIECEPKSNENSLNNALSSFATTSSQCTASCQNKLGVKYAAKTQYEKAFELFQQASEQGHSIAQFNLGLCFEHGRGTEQDLVRAAECYEKACASNHTGALYNLALFYMDGIGGIPKDHKKGLDLLEVAAQSGFRKAQSYLGIYYVHKPCKETDYSKAISYLEKAAIEKDHQAEYHLGVCYERGLGVECDMVKAGKLYESAAKHGNKSAQFNMGVFLQHGLGDFPVDYKEALRYYKMAALKGDKDAEHNYFILNKQLSSSLIDYDTFCTIFQQIFVNKNSNVLKKDMKRCSSSPDFNQSSKRAHSDTGNPLVIF